MRDNRRFVSPFPSRLLYVKIGRKKKGKLLAAAPHYFQQHKGARPILSPLPPLTIFLRRKSVAVKSHSPPQSESGGHPPIVRFSSIPRIRAG